MSQPILLELIGGPCDGEILAHFDWAPREILVPTYDGAVEITEIDPSSYDPIRCRAAVYRKAVDKNQYLFSGIRPH